MEFIKKPNKSVLKLTFYDIYQGASKLFFMSFCHKPLVSLFNDINVHSYLMPKPFLLKKKLLWNYLTFSWRNKGLHAFPNGISAKVNVKAWLEFELTKISQTSTLVTISKGLILTENLILCTNLITAISLHYFYTCRFFMQFIKKT